MSEIKEFKVWRPGWVRGNGMDSSLLGRDGKKCCLGFLAIACGHTDEEIFDTASPFELFNKDKRFLMPGCLVDDGNGNEEGVITCDSSTCLNIMEINDDVSISEVEREELLTKGFELIGIKVTFEG